MQNPTHFARSLRPQRLTEVIGQDFVVSMLQNSIFLGKFFPVYLFYGQRGCGKTTVARIIAKMINCSALEKFQKLPKETKLPCEECSSCLASKDGSHPDFIEIDAASHTGVDHVRTILESAHYLPLMGRKKIYLIDEAHMLSKAAFNALLKMLEEPPATALFILATTEINKIPVTVKSRAFQGIFNAPAHGVISKYLNKVAADHNIKLEDAAANLIVTRAERCVRDALNLLEQLGTLHENVTEQVVVSTFGLPDASAVLELLKAVTNQDHAGVIAALQQANYLDKNPTQFWVSVSEAFQSLVRVVHKAPAIGIFCAYEQELTVIANKTSQDLLARLNTLFWQAERIFNTTNTKHLFIEHFLASLCSPITLAHSEQPLTGQKLPAPQSPSAQKTPQRQVVQMATEVHINQNIKPKPTESFELNPTTNKNPSWDAFLSDLQTQEDKIPFGIFKRGSMLLEDSTLIIQIPNYNSFLEEQLSERGEVWRPLAFKHLPDHHSIIVRATQTMNKPISNTPDRTEPATQTPQLASRALASGPTTDLILKYFPGKLV